MKPKSTTDVTTRVNPPVTQATLKRKIEANVSDELATAREKQKKMQIVHQDRQKAWKLATICNCSLDIGTGAVELSRRKAFIVDTEDGKTLRRNSAQHGKSAPEIITPEQLQIQLNIVGK